MTDSAHIINMKSGYTLTDFDLYKDIGTSESSYRTFRETRARFGEFVKATAYINTDTGAGYSENTILHVVLDPQGYVIHYYPTLILEDEDGKKLALTGTSIGYGGTGPMTLVKILDEAGFKFDINEITNTPISVKRLYWNK